MSRTSFPVLSSSLAHNNPLLGIMNDDDDDYDLHLLDSLLGGLHSTSSGNPLYNSNAESSGSQVGRMSGMNSTFAGLPPEFTPRHRNSNCCVGTKCSRF
jgi:hypothetical protein